MSGHLPSDISGEIDFMRVLLGLFVFRDQNVRGVVGSSYREANLILAEEGFQLLILMLLLFTRVL